MVLPAPFGPIKAWISPATTSMPTWSVASRPPKRFTSPVVCRIVCAPLTVGAAPAARRRRLSDQARTDPQIPFSAISTIATISRPRTAIQCSVIDDSSSSIDRSASAPTAPPKTVPMPPRMTITTSSPDTVQALEEGET